MSRLVWSINVSLDGVADHTVGVGVGDESYAFFSDLLDHTELVVLGRVTYQLMEAAWPNAQKDPRATKRAIEFAEKFNAIPKMVFSRTLEKADWNNTRLVRGDIVTEVARLKQELSKNILLDGLAVAQEFVRRRMIDEYWFVVHPILAGKGRRVFDNLNDGPILRFVNAIAFGSGAVALHYENIENVH
jgi:dihydrofolate reductase